MTVIGDIGGFFEAIMIVSAFLVSPFYYRIQELNFFENQCKDHHHCQNSGDKQFSNNFWL
jgi:hypothetical protein